MDALLEPIRDLVEGQIDFDGQKLAEFFSTFLLISTSVLAFFLGWSNQDIYVTLWVGLTGTFLTLLIIVPPWPWFNQNPERWLPSTKHIASMPVGGIIMEEQKSR